MVSVEEVLGRLDKDVRERARLAIDISPERQELPSLGLTYGTGGGLGYGRQVMLWGPKSAAKTSFCLLTIAEAQKQGKTCAFIDIEKTYESEWAERLGVDTESLLYFDAQSMSHIADATVNFMQAGVDVLVWDSMTSIIPTSYMDEDELKSADSVGRIGALSSDMSKFLPMINYSNHNTLFIVISQMRMKFGGNYVAGGTTGGEAPKFYSSQIIKLWSSESKSNTITGDVKVGDKIIQKPVARTVRYDVEFNKLGPQGYSNQFDFYYDGDFVGIDAAGELIDLGLERGIIERGGAWYRYGEESWQGRDNAVAAIRDDEELASEIRGELIG